MKARLPMNSKSRKAMMEEINRQIIESDTKYRDNLDALVLYTLHDKYGFGPRRLRQFWEAMSEVHEELITYYDMPEDGPWIMLEKLKSLGVDIHQWNEEFMKTRRKNLESK